MRTSLRILCALVVVLGLGLPATAQTDLELEGLWKPVEFIDSDETADVWANAVQRSISLKVEVEGTGALYVTAEVGFHTLQPVQLRVKRAGCPLCPFPVFPMVGSWSESLVVGENLSPDLYRIDPKPDRLNRTYFFSFAQAGSYDVQLSVHDQAGQRWIDKVFRGIKVSNLDLETVESCQSGNEVKITLGVAALQEVDIHLQASVKIGGLPAVLSPVALSRNDTRRFETVVIVTAAQHAALRGTARPVLVKFNGKSWTEARTFVAPTPCS